MEKFGAQASLVCASARGIRRQRASDAAILARLLQRLRGNFAPRSTSYCICEPAVVGTFQLENGLPLDFH